MTDKTSLYIKKIDAALDKYLSNDEFGVKTLYDSMRYSVLMPGKRIRPIMSLSFCALCGADEAAALPFACAVEMIHAYSLIHDDLPCMDNDVLRRGKPTNHIVYGEAIALLAGDALLTKAFEVISGVTGIKPASVVEAVKVMSKLAGFMVDGQCIDLTLEKEKVSFGTLKQMDIGKTVGLISAACQMGCIAAGAPKTLQELSASYALNLGLAFQIRDDILGEVGDTASLGKTVGLDKENNKQNYVSLLGAVESQKLVVEYTNKAITILDKFSGNTEYLKKLTLSLVERTA